MATVDWESVMAVGAAAVFLAGIAVVLGDVIDRLGPKGRGGARRPSPRSSTPSTPRVQEPGRGAVSTPTCEASLEKLNAAVASNEPTLAAQSWLAAYRVARADQRWETLLAVGAARLRVATIAGGRKEAEAKARELYLLALFRARQQGSLDGLLKTAESFASLGDYRVADQALRLAEVFATATTETEALTERRGVIRSLRREAAGETAVQTAC